MRFFGSCERVRRGEICHPTTGTGKIPIAVFVERGLNSKMHLAVGALAMSLRMFITAGPVADCSQTHRFIKGIEADHLLADKGYESNAQVDSVEQAGINPVITPRKSRKNLRYYDKYLYRQRPLLKKPSWN